MADSVQTWLQARRALPAQVGESVPVPQRGSRYGEAYVVPVGKGVYPLADEGSYFVATNPTPGTGIAGIAATGAFSDAESLLYIKNGYSTSDDKRIYLDFLMLQVTAAGANGTDHRFVSKLEPSGTERYTSGGSTLTAVNPNADSNATSSATVRCGALVTTSASSNVRLLQNGLIRSVIAVVGDTYTFDFGGFARPATGHAVAGTAIASIVIPHVPVVIGPGATFVMSLHATSQTAATSYEVVLGWWER